MELADPSLGFTERAKLVLHPSTPTSLYKGNTRNLSSLNVERSG